MLVKYVMHKHPEAISGDKTFKYAAKLMQKKDFGFLPIKRNGQIAGVITNRDIIIRAISKGKDPNKIKLKDTMTKRIYFCYDSDNVNKAANIMSKKQINRLAVYNKNKQLIGVISIGDITRKSKDIALCGKMTKAIHKK